ncbi:MAG: hypothetical protein R3176_03610 [Woeseiaceae bacterium]|nr:hypothetical protein [Woeseiaceae bacterium]
MQLICGGRAGRAGKACVLAIAGLAVGACGGGGGSGGGGSPGPGPGPQPTGEVAIDQDNAALVAGSGVALAEAYLQLSLSAFDAIVDLSDSMVESIVIDCGFGSITATLTDADGSASISAGDTIALDYAACVQNALGDPVSGRIDVSIGFLVINPDLSISASVSVEFADLQFEASGTATVFATGAFTAFLLASDLLETLMIEAAAPQQLSVRIVDAGADVTEVASEVTVERVLTPGGTYAIEAALAVESQINGGSFSCSTPEPLAGSMPFFPDSGHFECVGAAGSKVRLVPTGADGVDTLIDPEGDGTFVAAPGPPGGQGFWGDYLEGQLVARRVDLPEVDPGALVPTLTTEVLELGSNAVAYDATRGVVYVTTDAGLTEVNPVTMLAGRSLPVTGTPGPIAVSDDGSVVWIGLEDTGEIVVVDAAAWGETGRIELGMRPGTMDQRFVETLLVAPGTNDTIVAAMRGGSEVVAYSGGMALPNVISGPATPTRLNFSAPNRIVGINDATSLFDASLLALDANGLTLIDSAPRYAAEFNNRIAVAGDVAYLNDGRVFDLSDRVILGRIDRDQVLQTPFKQGLALDATARRVYLYNEFEDVLEFHDADTLLLAGAFRIPASGGTTEILVAGEQFIIATDSELRSVPVSRLVPNRMRDSCGTLDLGGQFGRDFFVQTECRFNDAIYDPARDRIYASLPAAAGPAGNSVAVIDPVRGVIESTVHVGSEPNRLAHSANGDRLYVTLAEATLVGVVDLSMLAALGPVRLLPDTTFGEPQFPVTIATSPVSDTSLLVGTTNEIALYENGTRAPAVYDRAFETANLFFSADASQAFAREDFGELMIFDVDAAGITFLREDAGALRGPGNRQEGDTLLDTFGALYDAAAGAPVGTCPVGSSNVVGPDPESAAVYYLRTGLVSELIVCDSATFTITLSTFVPQFGGAIGTGRAIFPAGQNRFVVTTDGRMVFLDPAEF